MCQICNNALCKGCPPPTPPEGLTTDELYKNGWLHQPSPQELERLKSNAQFATENSDQIFQTLLNKIKI